MFSLKSSGIVLQASRRTLRVLANFCSVLHQDDLTLLWFWGGQSMTSGSVPLCVFLIIVLKNEAFVSQMLSRSYFMVDMVQDFCTEVNVPKQLGKWTDRHHAPFFQ